MQTSIFLAQLIGPVMLAGAISLLINGERQRAMARDFLDSAPLIYISGVLVMTAGLAIVLNHNVWAADWRVIITLFGWMLAIGGAIRIIFFSIVEKIGTAMLDKPWATTVAGVVWLAIAAVLCFYGYFA
jgi:hypothetical protein